MNYHARQSDCRLHTCSTVSSKHAPTRADTAHNKRTSRLIARDECPWPARRSQPPRRHGGHMWQRRIYDCRTGDTHTHTNGLNHWLRVTCAHVQNLRSHIVFRIIIACARTSPHIQTRWGPLASKVSRNQLYVNDVVYVRVLCISSEKCLHCSTI